MDAENTDYELTAVNADNPLLRPDLTNEEIVKELEFLKKDNSSLRQQVQSLSSQVARLDRDVAALARKRSFS